MGTRLSRHAIKSKFNKRFRFLLCVIAIYSKYSRVIPLKDKKAVTILNAFQKFLKESNRKARQIWVHKKDLLQFILLQFNEIMFRKNGIEMYLTRNEGKSVIIETLITSLKKVYNNLISV